MKRTLLASLLIAYGTLCFAQSGADALLDQLGEKPAVKAVKPGKKKRATVSDVSFKVEGDAFQQQLAVAALGHKRLSFDTKQWVQAVLDSDFAKAAHLWTAIQTQIPGDFHHEAEATQLYLLWKLGLNQTFFDQWVKALANSTYAEDNPEQVLESFVTPGLDGWLLKNAIVVSQKSQTILDRMKPDEAFLLTLKAYSNYRRETPSAEILPKLQPENKLTHLVAETVVYNRVKHDDLKGAAKVLRDYMEPAIDASKNPELLAEHDLSIARILYQAGQMKAAAQFYERIPNQSPSYLPSREELSWVYLRRGDMSKLRGELKGLSSPALKERFQPEVFLLKAVSDLKMCFYDLLDKDLSDFKTVNSAWAKRIDQSVNAGTTPVPSRPDYFTQQATKAVSNLTAEFARLNELGEQSIGATLPAVGQQRHWKDYRAQIQGELADAKKQLGEEYIRQWKNQRSELQEAIRKMRFVQVEYMSEIRQLAGGEALDRAKMVASNSESVPAAQVVKADEDSLNFPATQEVWSDEMFKLRSAAQAQCLKKSGTVK
jgi:tetratricopeptide (TPR) repeat protein